MSSGKKVVKGVVWTMLFNVVNAVYGFISVPILINYFGKSEYGLIGLAMSINVYLRLLDMGFTSTNVRFFSTWIAEGKKDKVQKAFQTSLGFYGSIGLLNALVLFVLALFSDSVFNVTAEQNVILKNLIYILCFTAFLSWLMSCLEQLVKATENVAWIQRVHLFAKLMLIAVLFVTVYGELSIEAYFILSCLASLSVIPFCISKIRMEVPYVSFFPRIDLPVFKEMLPYSLNIFSFSLFQFSFYHLRPVFLGMEGTVESVTDYRILNGIVGLVHMMSGAFIGALLPSTSRVIAKHNKEAYYKVAYIGTEYITIVVSFFCFCLMAMGSDLLTIYVGKEYLYLIPWLNLWLLCMLGNHNQAISSLILAGTDIRAISYSSVVASIAGLLVTWFTIPIYQIGGTVIGFVVYMAAQMAFYYFYYWPRRMAINSLHVFLRSFLPFLIVGIDCYIIVQYLPLSDNSWINVLARGSFFTLLYGIAVWAIITKEDRKFGRKTIKR